MCYCGVFKGGVIKEWALNPFMPVKFLEDRDEYILVLGEEFSFPIVFCFVCGMQVSNLNSDLSITVVLTSPNVTTFSADDEIVVSSLWVIIISKRRRYWILNLSNVCVIRFRVALSRLHVNSAWILHYL